MDHLIKYQYVPVRHTTLYKICRKLQLKDLPSDATWTELQKRGKKPFLSNRGLHKLIQEIKNSTDGGMALATSDIRDLVQRRIKDEWMSKRQLHMLPEVTIKTLNVYTSIIKSQSIFNVHSSVSNKTQARAAAEWSQRSTISYAMAVACSHFLVDAEASPFHPKQKDLSDESNLMWKLVEREYNNMIGSSQNQVKLQPILPNLVTSTDEVTVFATTSKVYGKEPFYIVSRPIKVKNEASDSSSRNNYTRTPTGDSHCRGVRIVINCSFTAGGLSSPLFVAVYGLSKDELQSEDDMVTIKVPGLTVGSDQDVYSAGYGYITFIRGRHEDDRHDESFEVIEDEEETDSKESRVASKYRTLVYHPFIDHIRISRYNWDPNVSLEVPPHLTAVSWMDGANGQLKKITCERNLELEKKKRVICCKHSASRTAVEQAADTGPMFKGMKSILKNMDLPNAAISHIYHYLEQELAKLQEEEVMILPNHKKKAILSTISKLPNATGKSHSISNIRKAFILNGQLDVDSMLVPSFENILHTFRGDIKNTCLENKEWLISTFFKEMYCNGHISEDSFDKYQIPVDRDMNGFAVERNFGVNQENRQRSKILSSPRQIAERRMLLHSMKMEQYQRLKRLYDEETKDYVFNRRCENKLMDIMTDFRSRMATSAGASATVTPSHIPMNSSFTSVCNGLTLDIIMSNKAAILLPEARAFVKVRSAAVVNRGKRTFRNIPTLKVDLLNKLFEMINCDVSTRFYSMPVMPTPLPSEVPNHNVAGGSGEVAVGVTVDRDAVMGEADSGEGVVNGAE